MRSFLWLVVGLSMTAESIAAKSIPCGVGKWPAELGNHRAVVQVSQKADAVWMHLPWRRRDEEPQEKTIVVVDAATGNRIANVIAVKVTRECGRLVFQPATVPGKYFV